MTSNDSGITRRRLLTGILGTAAAATLAGSRVQAAPAGKIRVVRVESPRVWNGDRRDPKVVAAMLERGITAFTGQKRADDAWRQYFKPGMRVGLKINLLGRPLVYTARELTEAVAAGALSAGVKPSDIVVWDRHADHFGPTDYKPGTGRLGERIQTGGRYDQTKVLKASGGHAPLDTTVAETDVTINLPVLKDHGGAGVTLALKNIAFGCYSHHRSAHGGNCDPYIAEAYEHYLTQTKVPLIVLDATNGCFDDGPQPRNPDGIWRENAIYIAADPVALDVVCRQVILDKRRAAGLSDKLRQSRHIETAAEKRLGVGDPGKIELVTMRV
ncbi:MAG TPA: DUF362 domain-containing protein [Vicinamibacterales bacterium]|jgi:uncharacterized protein (DUF362 family)